MQRERKSHVGAALMCAAVWGIAAQGAAQVSAEEPPGQSQDPVTQVPPTPEVATLPTSVPAYEPTAYQLTPPGAAGDRRSETQRWPNRPLLVTSTLMFTAAYVPAVMVAAISSDDTTDNLYIPVAGPFLEITQESATTGNKALLGVSGVFQGLGALGMLTSLMVPERRTSQWFLIGNKRLSVAPAASRLAYGVSASGRF